MYQLLVVAISGCHGHYQAHRPQEMEAQYIKGCDDLVCMKYD